MQMLADEVAAAMQSLDPPAVVYSSGDVARTLAAMLPQLAVEPSPLLDRPPLGYDPGLSARATGEQIARAYERYAETNRPSIAAVLAGCMNRLGCRPDHPVRRAAMAGAVLASVPCENTYHNANHTREVVCCAVWLSEANAALAGTGTAGCLPLDPSDIARLLLLAVMHDIGHDGGTNTRVVGGQRSREPYRLEDRSFALMHQVLRRAGIHHAELAELRAIVRSTDAAVRPAVRTLTEHVLYDRVVAHRLPPELDLVGRSKRLALLTALLADADILSSAALTPEYQRIQNGRLEGELSAVLGCDDVLAFLDNVVGGELATAAGRLLDANLQRIRALVVSQRDDVIAAAR
jgi:hypothetical protein